LVWVRCWAKADFGDLIVTQLLASSARCGRQIDNLLANGLAFTKIEQVLPERILWLSCLFWQSWLSTDFEERCFRVSTDDGSSLVELNPREVSLQRENFTRREMARRFLGVTAALSIGGLHPVWGHLLNESPVAQQGESGLANANWKPLFLSAEQNETLQSLSEAIVPGSTNALVSRFIDLLLSVDTPARQQKFIASLAAVQAEGDRRFGKSFQMLSASQRDLLLTAVSTSPENSATRASFEDLKVWIAGSYYSSEVGMKELGWTTNRFFPSFPGCTHPDGHL
jgi:hypothetical protein